MIYGPAYSTNALTEEMYKWLDANLTQGIDYNWEHNNWTGEWQLFFYNSEENFTAFRLSFGI